MVRALVVGVVVLLAGVGIACREQTASGMRPARAPAPDARGSAGPLEAGRLPEDPVAGKRSQEQWDEHLREEEEKRQLRYDRRKMKEHRAVLALLTSARARYDRATSEAAVARARARMPAVAEDVRRRLTAIDQWGNNSRLHSDYEALLTALAAEYPAAKSAALAGDPRPLAEARAEVEGRLEKISSWLARAAETEDE